jgi:RNA recognition motif-containing protein
VEFVNPEDALKAKEAMNEKELWERLIRVDFAKENPDRIQNKEESEE